MSYFSAAIRKQVSERANNCCEYCLVSREDRLAPYEVDHIRSKKHDGSDDLDNLAWACYLCNGFKGTDIASADPITDLATFLFHPRRQKWIEHFRLDGARIEPLTAEGRVTVFLLKFNTPERVAERAILIRAKRYPCPSST